VRACGLWSDLNRPHDLADAVLSSGSIRIVSWDGNVMVCFEPSHRVSASLVAGSYQLDVQDLIMIEVFERVRPKLLGTLAI
jgi:hypothetical protein